MRKFFLSLLCALTCLYSSAQDRKVEGIIKTPDGTPISNVNILVTGTNRGTSSKATGRFSINVPNETTKLEITAIGFTKLDLDLTKKNYYEVTLIPTTKELDQVIVVGYGTQKKNNVTGSVGVISGASFSAKPVTSASQALAGRIAGVHVAQNNGIAGSDGAQISIRGIGSLGNNAPLILIDGVISPTIDVVNPNDIQSISVLKDAASASIYGSQAANGVILITTKKGGKDAKAVFTYEGGYSVSEITKNSKPQMITDPVLYMTLLNEARQNSAGAPVFTEEQIEQYATPSFRDKVSTDWYEELVRKGAIQQHDMSVRGGNQTTQYFMSLGYMDQNAILTNGNFKRITSRINLETQIIPKIRMGVNFAYTFGNTRTPNGSIDDNSLLNIIRGTPLNPAYTDDGFLATPDQSTLPAGNFQNGNPLAAFVSNDIKKVTNNLTGRIFIDWEVIKNLKLSANLTTSLNLDYYQAWFGRPTVRVWRYKELINNSSTSISSLTSFYGFGSLTHNTTRRYRVNPYVQATYNFEIGKHNFGLLGGFSSEVNTHNYFETSRGNFLSNYVQVFSAGDPATMQNYSANSKNAFVSQFGRLNYNFESKYLFEANIRRDGSSRFGPNYKYGIFPSFSAGWVASKESFFKSIPAISYLKIRGSWGQLGNQGSSDDFPYISRITYDGANYVWGNTVFTGARPATYGNADVHWETSTMSNIGANLHLFKSMIQIEADYFNKLSDDILFNTPLPSESGFSSVVSNLASVRNKGIEASILFTKKLGNFNLDVSVNGSKITNEVLKLNPEQSDEGDRVISGEKIIQRGQPINAFYLVKWTGRIFQNQQEVDNLPHQPNAAPGDLIFEDISGIDGKPDGKIDANDRVPMGTQYPTLTFGGSVNLSYKGISVSADFQGIKNAYGYGSFEYFYPTFQGSNIPIHWIDRWTPENPSLTKPRLWTDEGPNTELKNTYFLLDRSYLRLRNVLVSYQIPQQIIKRLSLNEFKVYLSASNLATWTKYKGFDPEITRDASLRGGLPQVRMFKAGAIVTF
jgi:TonB-linked SusC/RagA family outer membrane protein